jgi:hypothetical protein
MKVSSHCHAAAILRREKYPDAYYIAGYLILKPEVLLPFPGRDSACPACSQPLYLLTNAYRRSWSKRVINFTVIDTLCKVTGCVIYYLVGLMLLLQASDNHLGLLRIKTQELMDENASTPAR